MQGKVDCNIWTEIVFSEHILYKNIDIRKGFFRKNPSDSEVYMPHNVASEQMTGDNIA